jgi:antirestriction protein ArdC
MSTNENTAQKPDVYQKVTDAIVNAIEQGAGKYEMPWNTRSDRAFSPISVGSAKAYRGINTLVLWAEAQAKGYNSGLWGTYQQWSELGGQVRKGEKSSPVVYWGSYRDKNESEEESTSRTHLFCKGYSVFNLSQVDNVQLPEGPKLPHGERIQRADEFFAALPMKLNHGFNRAFYSPSTDSVSMPDFDQFPEAIGYYSVLAHESTHWTSHKDRCGRELGKRFGDSAYAMEELVAELGAAYTMANLELATEPRPDHAAYLDSWLKVLKADSRAIFTAASQAQKAADYLKAQAEAGHDAKCIGLGVVA